MSENILDDVASLTVGYAFKSSEFVEPSEGTRLVRCDNIGHGSLRWDGAKAWRPTNAEIEKTYSLEVGDVVVAMDRPWIASGLKRAVVQDSDLPSLLVQRVARLRAKPGTDQGFIRVLVESKDFTDHILSVQTGTTVPHVSGRQILSFSVPKLPPIAEQRAIADVLGALDDKIESNRRIWRLRQEIAVAYFNLCRSRSEAEIPMNDLYRVGLSGVWGEESPTDSSTIETTCLRGRDLEDYMTGSHCAPPARFITNRQLEARNPELGEIWTAGSGSLGPSLLITESVKKRWGAPITNSNFVKRLVPIGEHIHHAPAFHVVWESWKSGGFSNFRTGTAMPNLDPYALLRGLSVPQLTIQEIRALTDFTEVALDSQLPKETLALSNLRDALLPELLSGRLRVRDAEKVVEGAL